MGVDALSFAFFGHSETEPKIDRKTTGDVVMAKTGPRNQITLKSTESNHCYYSSKNRRNQQGRLEVKKYDPTLRKHVMYREER